MLHTKTIVKVLLAVIYFCHLSAAQQQCSGYNEFYNTTDSSCSSCGVLEYPNSTGTGCIAYRSRSEKEAGDKAAKIDTGNTAWMLCASALVMVMTPALGLFYAGLVGETNVLNTMLMSIVSIAIVTISWVIYGYSFAFGPGNGRFGMGEWTVLDGDTIGATPSAIYGTGVPHSIFVAFQCMFAQITPALISGAVIGRMKFVTYCIYILLWSNFIYSPLAQWMWSLTLDDNGAVVPRGWLNKMGAIDFAGGSVIHIASGFAALAAAIIVGRRKYAESTKPHNIPMVMQGASLLWFGWFGFNAGSAGAANGIACIAFLNSHIAAASAVLTWMIVETIHEKTQTPVCIHRDGVGTCFHHPWMWVCHPHDCNCVWDCPSHVPPTRSSSLSPNWGSTMPWMHSRVTVLGVWLGACSQASLQTLRSAVWMVRTRAEASWSDTKSSPSSFARRIPLVERLQSCTR